MKWDALIITDLHVYGKNPLCRLDDLVETQFEKMMEISDVSNELKIPVICAGDITNSPYVSYSITTILSNWFQTFQHGFYYILGQHDIVNHELNSLDGTAMGTLIASLPEYLKHIREFKNDYGYGFDFASWGQEIQRSKNSFLITHRPVVLKSWVSKFNWLLANQNENKYYLFEDLCKNYKLIITGDWHRRYIIRDKNCLLINAGSLTRREANKDSQETFPSYVLINFKNLEYELVPLKSAKPFDEVISTSHLELGKFQKSLGKDLIDYMNSLNLANKDQSKYFQFLDSCMKNLPKESLSILKEIIQETFGDKIKYENIRYKLKVKKD